MLETRPVWSEVLSSAYMARGGPRVCTTTRARVAREVVTRGRCERCVWRVEVVEGRSVRGMTLRRLVPGEVRRGTLLMRNSPLI